MNFVAPKKYHLEGTRRRIRDGGVERFDTYVIAANLDDACVTARYNWCVEWEDVQFTCALQVD